MTGQSFDWWTRPEPAEVYDLHARSELQRLFSNYQGTRHDIVGEVLSQAQQAGARSVVAEHRYLDADYRNEHSRFYSTTFRRYPSIAHRLHFFANFVPTTALSMSAPSSFAAYGYRGYSVMRPVPAGPIGRTVLAPPPDLAAHISAGGTDKVNLFGTELAVDGAPFMTQESQLGVCIHVTAWVCAYAHHLQFAAERFLPGDIAGFAPHEVGRLVPAPGMSVGQLSAIFETAGLPAVVYDLEDLPPDETKFSIACRYLNSGFPVVVAGGAHAFVLVGYRRVGGESVRIEFIRQDDQRGPYDVVEDPLYDYWRPWEYLVIPLPPKVYVSGEKAETVAGDRIHNVLVARRDAFGSDLLSRIADRRAVFRATAMPSNRFKTGLRDRGADDDVIGVYHWTPMSRWVWVVEVIDHDAWDTGAPSVIGEVLIDATDHTGDPRPLAWRIGGAMAVWDPDTNRVASIAVAAGDRLTSVCKIDPSLQEL